MSANQKEKQKNVNDRCGGGKHLAGGTKSCFRGTEPSAAEALWQPGGHIDVKGSRKAFLFCHFLSNKWLQLTGQQKTAAVLSFLPVNAKIVFCFFYVI